MHQINFELQHPLFMVLTAFAITITGVILRYRLMSLAVLFWSACPGSVLPETAGTTAGGISGMADRFYYSGTSASCQKIKQ